MTVCFFWWGIVEFTEISSSHLRLYINVLLLAVLTTSHGNLCAAVVFDTLVNAHWMHRIVQRTLFLLDCKLKGMWICWGLTGYIFCELDVLRFNVEIEELVFFNHVVADFLSLEDLAREDLWVKNKLVIWVIKMNPSFGISLSLDILAIFDESLFLLILIFSFFIKIKENLSWSLTRDHMV